MHIEELELKNYRNYETLSISFENNVNVILGENAQGKTNVMESIYVLAMAKSHRTSNDKDLIRWDQEYAKIKGRIKKLNGSIPLELIISKKGKKAKFNHIEQQKLSQYVGNMNVVMFAPEDLHLVKGALKLGVVLLIWKLVKYHQSICMISVSIKKFCNNEIIILNNSKCKSKKTKRCLMF